jgi:CheY-like chemotaxis protein
LITNYSLSEDKRGRIKILLVEDNAINRKLVIHLLEHFGFQSQAVFNGKEAIEALSVGIYDIVLMDIEMPEMDGFEATRLIRNPASMVIDHQVPIIAVTAHASASDHHACLAAGMDDYISKPIRPEAFLQVVEKCIKDHRKSD